MKFGAKIGLLLVLISLPVMGQQKVRSYHRKDGTFVDAYTRRPRAHIRSGTAESSEAATDNYSVPHPQKSHNKIKRSQASKDTFKFEHPCPSTGKSSGACPGYVIDHVDPLACGGADAPFNMQWQTIAEGKAKDKWERKACGK